MSNLTEHERSKLPLSDFAGPGRTFPIIDQDDVDSAAKLLGKADDPEKVKASVIAIAKKRDLAIPAAWHKDDSGKSLTLGDLLPEDTLATVGGNVKALGNGKIELLLVVKSDADSPDLQGDFFDSETDFGPHQKSIVFWDHCQDKTLKNMVLDQAGAIKSTDEGIWLTAQLDMSDKYQKMIYKMAENGALGASSGTAKHLVTRTAVKNTAGETVHHIDTWPLGIDASLTPTPVEPRTKGTCSVKSLSSPSFDDLAKSIKSDGPSQWDRRDILSDSLRAKLGRAGGCYYYWLTDVFETTLVYSVDDPDGGANYFEASYSFDGLIPTIGDGVQVLRLTKYEPIPQGGATKSLKSKASTVGQILQAKIHQAFTIAADELALRGYMDVAQRIALSGNIGDMLRAFDAAVDAELAGAAVEPYDVDFVAAKGLNALCCDVDLLTRLTFADHSNSVQTAVKGFSGRVGDYVATRTSKQRSLSESRATEFKAIRDELEAGIKALDDALLHAPKAPADPDQIKTLKREALALDPAAWSMPALA